MKPVFTRRILLGLVAGLTTASSVLAQEKPRLAKVLSSEMGKPVKQAGNEIGAMADDAAVALARSHGIDIAIDLKGYTQGGRVQLFARRLAPVQIAYLGYPGSSGADFMDYLIADPVVVPQAMSEHYAEFVVRIPDSFMPRDTTVAIPAERPRRETHGLPEQALVLCSFNNSYKLNPASFEIWMRLLGAVEDAVLWLSESNPSAVANLRAEAARRGIAADRLIFAPRLPRIEDHYARLPLADLFLDTWPYNAHTTASDALWAGVPVLTCAGETFASRVAASLLTAIGLPELIADSPSAYERLAFDLARSRDRLAGIRAKLATHRLTYPLFDMARFTRHIEAAYAKMWARHQAGEPPSAFDISPQ